MGTNNIDDILNQRTETHLVSLSADFGISDRLSISSSIPMIISRSINNSIDETRSGLGDLSTTMQYSSSFKFHSMPINTRIGAGASLPVGSGVANVETGLPNFSSGVVDPIVNLLIAAGIRPGFSIHAQFYSRQVISYSGGIKSGDIYLYSINGSYSPIGGNYTIGSGISFINRGQDKYEGLDSTQNGSDRIIFSANGSKAILGSGESPFRIWGGLQLPVYLFVDDVQLTESWSLRFGISKGITIFGHKEQKDETGEHFHIPVESD